MRKRLFVVTLLVALSMGSSQAFAATVKVGGACAKAGLPSGALTCAHNAGQLIWQIVKKSQVITYSIAAEASISDKSVILKFAASSKLVVSANSLTPTICTPGRGSIIISGTPGICRIALGQKGNLYYLPAKTVTVDTKILEANIIDFQLPGALLLSTGTYTLMATTSSTLGVTFASSTPGTCSVTDTTLSLLQAGTCTVLASQSGTEFVAAADSVPRSTEISTDRVSADLPDTVSGFQIKAIYVVPSDGVDKSYDTNGYIAGILDEGNAYLQSQIGKALQIDSKTTGYDIQYLRSKYSTEFLRTHEASNNVQTSDSYLLLREIEAMENPGDNRKDYLFFIEVPGFSGTFCGLADTPGMKAVVALEDVSNNGICRGVSAPLFANYTTKTWLHEFLHTLGVDHTEDDPCDLMASGDTPCNALVKYTMDKERSRYVGTASAQGPDIFTLRIWKGETGDQTKVAHCILNPVPRLDGVPYAYCPTGTRFIGEIGQCWSSVNSVTLEEFVGGIWVSLGAGITSPQMWGGPLPDSHCGNPSFPVAVQKQMTVDTPGIHHYRWVVDGNISQHLNVIWVK